MNLTDRLRWRLGHGNATRTRYRNWLNRRAWERGRVPLPDRITRRVASSVPVYRNRINRATGRPHRDDRQIGAVKDRALARTKLVRETLAERQPEFARNVERAGRTVDREMTPRRRGTPSRTGRRSR